METNIRKERLLREIDLSVIHPNFNSRSSTVACPFCNKKKGWMNSDKKYFICWSSRCGVKGDLVQIYKLLQGYEEGKGFYKALEELEVVAGISDKEQEEERILVYEKALECYSYNLFTKEGKEAKEYLNDRGFSDEALEMYGIGYAASDSTLRKYGLDERQLITHDLLSNNEEYYKNRIIFPIRNSQGRVVHLQGRYLGDVPKENGEDKWPRYKDTRPCDKYGSSKNYFAFEEDLKTYSDTLYICEGYPDALSLRQLGFPCIGILSLDCLHKQFSKLKKFKNIVALFDNDVFEEDHPYYKNEYKSWRKIIPQLIELQFILPSTIFYTILVPEIVDYKNKVRKCKDVNDWVKGMRKEEVEKEIENRKEELVSTLIKRWGPEMSQHLQLLKLVQTTGREANNLKRYIPEEYDSITYALHVLGS